MIRGMYSAASALDAAMQRQTVNAENLAMMSNPGYRGKGIVFESFDRALDAAGAGINGVSAGQVYTNFQAGQFQQTGSPYHLALDGEAFFSLQTPRGEVYTRNGTFHRGPGGEILSEGNYPLLGAGGPITVPADAVDIAIGSDGKITADGNAVGTLKLTQFGDPQKLVSVGPSLYEAPPDAQAKQADGGVRQGYLESANVSPTNAMIDMIESGHYFEMAQRAMRAISDSIQLNTRPGA
jgi:flagellar basal-body rod protein FlgF